MSEKWSFASAASAGISLLDAATRLKDTRKQAKQAVEAAREELDRKQAAAAATLPKDAKVIAWTAGAKLDAALAQAAAIERAARAEAEAATDAALIVMSKLDPDATDAHRASGRALVEAVVRISQRTAAAARKEAASA